MLFDYNLAGPGLLFASAHQGTSIQHLEHRLNPLVMLSCALETQGVTSSASFWGGLCPFAYPPKFVQATIPAAPGTLATLFLPGTNRSSCAQFCQRGAASLLPVFRGQPSPHSGHKTSLQGYSNVKGESLLDSAGDGRNGARARDGLAEISQIRARLSTAS